MPDRSALHPPATRPPLSAPSGSPLLSLPLPLARLGLRICRRTSEAGDVDPGIRASRAPRLSPAHIAEERAAFPPSPLPLAGLVLLNPQPSHTAPHSPDSPATAPTFGDPGLASEGRSDSRVSSRAQASSWERCMVPVEWRGTHWRQRGQMRRQALSGLAGLLCRPGSQSCAAPAGCALSPPRLSSFYNPTCR